MDRFVAAEHRALQQLEAERDPAKRANLEKLLEEAREQLRQAEEAHRRDDQTRQ